MERSRFLWQMEVTLTRSVVPFLSVVHTKGFKHGRNLAWGSLELLAGSLSPSLSLQHTKGLGQDLAWRDPELLAPILSPFSRSSQSLTALQKPWPSTE